MLVLFSPIMWAKEEANSVRELVERLAHPIFPRTADVMAIIRIESEFNPLAVNGKNKGLMQVLHGSFDPCENIAQGVQLLHEYYRILRDPHAAVMAYNSGIGRYLDGVRSEQYLAKFQKLRRKYDTHAQPVGADKDHASSPDHPAHKKGGGAPSPVLCRLQEGREEG